MLSSEVALSLKRYGQFWGRDCSQSPPCSVFGVKQIHQSTASERTTRLRSSVLYNHNLGSRLGILPSKAKGQYLLTLQVSRSCPFTLQLITLQASRYYLSGLQSSMHPIPPSHEHTLIRVEFGIDSESLSRVFTAIYNSG